VYFLHQQKETQMDANDPFSSFAYTLCYCRAIRTTYTQTSLLVFLFVFTMSTLF